jgi:hypothetical protein
MFLHLEVVHVLDFIVGAVNFPQPAEQPERGMQPLQGTVLVLVQCLEYLLSREIRKKES